MSMLSRSTASPRPVRLPFPRPSERGTGPAATHSMPPASLAGWSEADAFRSSRDAPPDEPWTADTLRDAP
eukprot:scaffold89228_cov68-Phaeocystis_antarctica.AAC.4